MRRRLPQGEIGAAMRRLPWQVTDLLPVAEQEIAIENIKIRGEAQVGLAEHEAVVPFVRQDDEIADEGEEDQIPFMIGDVVVEGDQMPVRSVELRQRGILYISYLEVAELIGADLMEAYFPLAEVFVVVLDDGFVVAVVSAVLFPESFFEFGTRQEPADCLMVPATVDIAVEFLDVRGLAGPKDILQRGTIGLGQCLVSPFRLHMECVYFTYPVPLR
jgi:hypothetical protein